MFGRLSVRIILNVQTAKAQNIIEDKSSVYDFKH